MSDLEQGHGIWPFAVIVGSLLTLLGRGCVVLAFGFAALYSSSDSSVSFDRILEEFPFEIGLVALALGVPLQLFARHRARRSSPPNEEPEADRDAPSAGDDQENGGAGS